MTSTPDNPAGADDGRRLDAGGGRLSVPVDGLNRLAQIFDAAADDIDAAIDRLGRDLGRTDLNRQDPDLAPRSVADDTATARAMLRRVTAQLRADAGLMAATVADTVEADTVPPVPGHGHLVDPGMVDETAGWLGMVADRLRPVAPGPDGVRPPSGSDDHPGELKGTPVEDPGMTAGEDAADAVWERVSEITDRRSRR